VNFVSDLNDVFAALHAALYFVPFILWRNWAIYLAPIEGVALGPGLLAAFIGSVAARLINLMNSGCSV